MASMGACCFCHGHPASTCTERSMLGVPHNLLLMEVLVITQQSNNAPSCKT